MFAGSLVFATAQNQEYNEKDFWSVVVDKRISTLPSSVTKDALKGEFALELDDTVHSRKAEIKMDNNSIFIGTITEESTFKVTYTLKSGSKEDIVTGLPAWKPWGEGSQQGNFIGQNKAGEIRYVIKWHVFMNRYSDDANIAYLVIEFGDLNDVMHDCKNGGPNCVSERKISQDL